MVACCFGDQQRGREENTTGWPVLDVVVGMEEEVNEKWLIRIFRIIGDAVAVREALLVGCNKT